ncbi:hypothetical protein DSM104440_03808 [Usitatibacter palustris]|uniref:Dienelactone hydrolase domain-containing protein n=2 Tax=Usitatibacter palustris TaxID=2732487 RepID=A0A6M4HBL0_9PROT|nr:hypothetical protein DSM104440_03808 [Usitatibacter palustris]
MAQGEPVHFPGDGVELTGRLYRPTGPGPFPAIVLMHGCSGMWRQDGREPTTAYDFWAEHWRGRGYVALLVDSFGPRGEKEICTQKKRPISPARDRPKDAYASLSWLTQRKDVRAGHVHLMGWSNGAMAVLNAIQPDAPGRTSDGPQFRSAVAFYPGCAQIGSDYRPVAPLLIQAGAADDWTPARHCEALAARSKDGKPVEIDVYPGAHHAFDGYGKVRTRSDVSNAASPTGWGATVGANPTARNQAITRTTAWVAARDR